MIDFACSILEIESEREVWCWIEFLLTSGERIALEQEALSTTLAIIHEGRGFVLFHVCGEDRCRWSSSV